MLKVLLIGSYPPPHGGVSVHVRTLRQRLKQHGIACRVLNVDPRAAKSPGYLTIRNPWDLFSMLLYHARRGWLFHVHTNGANLKSWLIALAAGLVGSASAGRVLTLHSGLLPDYLNGRIWRRSIARKVCSLYDFIIAVNGQIRDTLVSLRSPPERMCVLPAFLRPSTVPGQIPPQVETWLRKHSPRLCAPLFFRPEYGFNLLLRAAAEIRKSHPGVGFVIMGSGEGQDQARESLQHYGLEECVLLTGDLQHAACLSLMARSDLLVRATFIDGDAISVREALALGTPVVASDVVPRPEGALTFRTGDLINLVSVIRIALEKNRNVTNGQQHAAGQDTLERLLEIYRQICISNHDNNEKTPQTARARRGRGRSPAA